MREIDALELIKSVTHLYAAKGKNVVHVDLKREKPNRETLKKLMLGPTGNLRAPALIKGKTLVVGFDQQTYEQVFG